MKQTALILILLIFSSATFAKGVLKEKDKQQILALLDTQVAAWNDGNLEKFMDTYWHSDKLVFVGSRGPTYGWQATLDSYKRGYRDKKAMGILKFDILDISKIDKNTVFAIGRFEVTREAGDLNGHFTLVIQKKQGRWKIISDHSSAEN